MTDTNVEDKKRNRSFKVKLSPESGLYGRYNGDSPYQAANKALSEIIRNKVKNNESIDVEINFYLVESTKGSKKKCHQYTGKRVQLEKPVIYKVGEQEIVKNYKNILKKVKRNDDSSESNTKKTTTKSSKSTKTAAKKVTAKKTTSVTTKENVKVATKKVTTKKTTKNSKTE